MRPLIATALAASLASAVPAPPARADDGAPTCTPAGAIAVDGLGTPWDDLVRAGVLTGAVAPSPGVLRRGGARVERLCAESNLPWAARAGSAASAAVGPGEAGRDGLRIIPLRLDAAWNAKYPSGGNDGLLWAGRGLSSMLSGGVAFRKGVVSGALAPEVAWSENRAFDLVPNGQTGDLRFRDPWYGDGIDLPQRFGDSTYTKASFGQSYLRVDAFNVAAGISTENRWHGPGLRNSLTLSNAGPGFPHLFVGTSRPANIWIGTAEALVFWGRLERTRYLTNPTHPLLQGLLVDYTPRWVPGLTVGASRLYLQVWDGPRREGLVRHLPEPAKGGPGGPVRIGRRQPVGQPAPLALLPLGLPVVPAPDLRRVGPRGRRVHPRPRDPRARPQPGAHHRPREDLRGEGRSLGAGPGRADRAPGEAAARATSAACRSGTSTATTSPSRTAASSSAPGSAPAPTRRRSRWTCSRPAAASAASWSGCGATTTSTGARWSPSSASATTTSRWPAACARCSSPARSTCRGRRPPPTAGSATSCKNEPNLKLGVQLSVPFGSAGGRDG